MRDPNSTLPPAHSSLPFFLSHQTKVFLLPQMPHTPEDKRRGKGAGEPQEDFVLPLLETPEHREQLSTACPSRSGLLQLALGGALKDLTP